MNICKCTCGADSASVTASVLLTVSMGHLPLNEKHLTCDWHFGYLGCVNCCFDRASQTSGDCQLVLSCQTSNLRLTLSDHSNRRLIMVVHQERSLSLERVTTRLSGPEALLAPRCRQSASHWDCVNNIATRLSVFGNHYLLLSVWVILYKKAKQTATNIFKVCPEILSLLSTEWKSWVCDTRTRRNIPLWV